MKKGTVFCCGIKAGELIRDDDGYVFRYDPLYFADTSLPAVSATLPKTRREYHSKVLFPFFFGLLAEGAQKERQCRELHIDENDHFTRLLETSAYGAIGAVYVTA
ncbi:MAG: HipA N-terminal domain-containing protein [Kiritimatiellae bacterium]|nr:HipA N-terminal domain-containing protein [Kiritimatiellia bacterium]